MSLGTQTARPVVLDESYSKFLYLDAIEDSQEFSNCAELPRSHCGVDHVG
jgi:hypothetical protein